MLNTLLDYRDPGALGVFTDERSAARLEKQMARTGFLEGAKMAGTFDALRPNDLFILTSDHGCDPTTPSTDHSREHALLLAYVEGRNADGAVHEGEFADVGATVNAWLGGKAPSRGIPGTPIVEQ